eukprot:m.762056 g.762056  ORF g.762056 m.762056 type:complete len:81 (+) comp23208_c1_seq15:328-570(+)
MHSCVYVCATTITSQLTFCGLGFKAFSEQFMGEHASTVHMVTLISPSPSATTGCEEQANDACDTKMENRSMLSSTHILQE